MSKLRQQVVNWCAQSYSKAVAEPGVSLAQGSWTSEPVLLTINHTASQEVGINLIEDQDYTMVFSQLFSFSQ